MTNVFSQLFIDSFVRGVGKTSGTLITMFVGWQMFKITNGHDDFLSFLLGKRSKKNRRAIDLHSEKTESEHEGQEKEVFEQDHEEINLEDMDSEHKFKSLFDKF